MDGKLQCTDSAHRAGQPAWRRRARHAAVLIVLAAWTTACASGGGNRPAMEPEASPEPPAAPGTSTATAPTADKPASAIPGSSQAAGDQANAALPTHLADQVVAASDRDPADVEKDALRRPAELLRFVDVRAGMRVADLGAGSGYTTELLARAVGPNGRIYAQNNRHTLEKFVRESWPARLAKPVMSNVVRVDAELDSPLPAPATDLDLVTMIFFYHDAVALDADVGAMNRAVLAALKPGGLFVVADHHGQAGSGTRDSKTLHRIDVESVKTQVLAAGFELVGEADFLRNTDDTRDWKVWERGFQTDRFVLKFRKPQ